MTTFMPGGIHAKTSDRPSRLDLPQPPPPRPPRPALAILGTRGIPARHGGFETFAQRLALFLAQRGWQVAVYCQEDNPGPVIVENWHGVRLIRIPAPQPGPWGTMIFDFKSTLHAARRGGVLLTLGYNTALFCGWYRLRGRKNLINMDGLEWKRGKWNRLAKAWLYLNERLACRFGDRLIADHPQIASHLATRAPANKIVTIPYGSDPVDAASVELLGPLGLDPDGYALVVARPEPENSVLEIVSAFSSRPRQKRLVVLGNYDVPRNRYHARVRAAASGEVLFPGAIYDQATLDALRFYAALYIHGHTVGGTNPALVEALGAGCAILAQDNRFNRWVAGEAARYFHDQADCAGLLDELLDDEAGLNQLRTAARQRHAAEFTWDRVLAAYESLLWEYVAV
jgi:glycosyltransferase involved in cell wall biosynthesis